VSLTLAILFLSDCLLWGHELPPTFVPGGTGVPRSDFVVLTKHGTAMMDSNLIPEAYRLRQITAVGEAVSVRRLWNSH
jgi:hypothetical protein